jgi:multicomponent Na+:H+ antiporter subunit G
MREAISVSLLAAGVAVQLLAVLGVTLLPDALDRVHFLAPSGLATTLIAAAVLVAESFSVIGVAAVLLALFTLVTAPVLGHVTAHAIHRDGERER